MTLSNLTRRVFAESLYRNSAFLFLAGAVNGGFSFIFWVLAAHLYRQSDVGRATALFAAVSLIATFGTLGFNNSLIRYLPQTHDQSRMLNTAYTLVASTATVVAVIFLLILPQVASSLDFVRHDVGYCAVFVLFVVATSLSTIIDNNFIAFRSTHFTLLKSFVLNVFELTLLFVLVGSGSFGLFGTYSFSFALVVACSFQLLRRRFGYEPRFGVDPSIARQMGRYSLGNYITTYLNSLPAFALPLIVTSQLGVKANAVYFIAYNVSYLLFLVPLGIGNALFAEASHEAAGLTALIRRSAKLNAIVIIPAVAIVVIAAPLILLLFGNRYATPGVPVLRVLALSGILVSVCYPCGAILNVLYRIRTLIVVNFVGCCAVLAAVYLLILNGGGLVGAAWGWTLGWGVYALVYLVAVWRALDTVSATAS